MSLGEMGKPAVKACFTGMKAVDFMSSRCVYFASTPHDMLEAVSAVPVRPYNQAYACWQPCFSAQASPPHTCAPRLRLRPTLASACRTRPQHLLQHTPADDVISPDDWIQLPFACSLGQVPGILAQRLILRLWRLGARLARDVAKSLWNRGSVW